LEDFESLLLLPFVAPLFDDDPLELEEVPLFEDLELCKIFDPMFVILSIVGLTTLVIVGPIFVMVGLSIPPVGVNTALLSLLLLLLEEEEEEVGGITASGSSGQNVSVSGRGGFVASKGGSG